MSGESIKKITYGPNHKPFSLMLATAFYEVKAYSPYIMSLIDSIRVLHELGVDWTFKSISGDSYVDRAKNSLIHDFLKSDYSHIFMIDSDEAWDVNGFCRIIKAAIMGAEIVGAAYPCKNNWEFYGCVPNKAEDGSFMGKEIGDMRLLDMWGIPGGFLIYSREAIERTRPKLNSYIIPENGESVLECFRCNIEKDGGRVGEDIYMQLRYKDAGGIIWLEPNVTIQHYGVKEWVGNYNDYLLRQKAANDIEASVGTTEAETAAMLAALGKKGDACA